MSAPLLFAMPGNEEIAGELAVKTGAACVTIETRRFPDGESYVRIASPVADSAVALVATLAAPDMKFLPLVFAAKTLCELGATKVGLIAPYLAYMRQDKRFHDGEAVTGKQFAALLSESFDWLVTVDPHLHRVKSLSEIYAIPTSVAAAAPDLARWIAANVEKPFLVGPDVESRQWVEQVAGLSRAPFAVLTKARLGDRKVELRADGFYLPSGHTPVILDDIVSSGETMLQAVRLLRAQTRVLPVCVAVHGLFSNLSDAEIEAECERLVCTNTVPNRHGVIDIAPTLAESVKGFLC